MSMWFHRLAVLGAVSVVAACGTCTGRDLGAITQVEPQRAPERVVALGGHSLIVQVQALDGQPHAGAGVVVSSFPSSPEDGPENLRSQYAGSEGVAAFHDMAPGRYTIQVGCTDFIVGDLVFLPQKGSVTITYFTNEPTGAVCER